MVRISRKEGESIVLYADDPATAGKLGSGRVILRIKNISHGANGRVDFAISAPKEVEILREELVTTCDTV